MTDKDATKGIWLMIAAVTVFAMQDGFSRHLAETYNTFMVIMIRYWFFVGFVVLLAWRQPQGFRASVRTHHPWLHLTRAVLLIAEVCVIADSPEPVPPCGGCRQKIAEFAAQDVRVTLCTTDGGEKVMTVADLLPGVFSAAHMDRT